MANVIQKLNSNHFQQAHANGASSTSASDFANGLLLFRTPDQVVNRNIEAILSGTFNKNQIQSHEIPYYNELCRTHTPIEKIGEPISPANYDKYWTNMKESTASSPSGRYVGMYKKQLQALRMRMPPFIRRAWLP